MTFLQRIVTFFPSLEIGRYCGRWVNCAFGTLQASAAFLLLLSIAHPSHALAANPDLETVLNGSRQRIETMDYRVNGRLTRVAADGKRTNYKFVAKAHWFPDGLRLICEISGPASAKTSLLLHMTESGHITVEALLPGEKHASVLPFEHWNDPLVGTDFTYEDMVENQFFWKNQEILPADKCGARDCFVLKEHFRPTRPDPLRFSDIVDRSHHSVPRTCREDGSRYRTTKGVHLLRTAQGRRSLVSNAAGGKIAGQTGLLDDGHRRGNRKGKSPKQRLRSRPV